MQHIQRSALVNHTAEQMFDLVNDIEAYPSFMPGCRGARVLEATENELVGELQLGAVGVEQRLTTRNTLERPHKIAMTLIEGDFTEFFAAWHFKALSEEASKVSLEMRFAFSRALLNAAASSLFSKMANAQVDAMVKRAAEVYRV
ncbi:MAG: type II toxin-antitoxin system RatA family toxin [Pseudomonadota bacterium]|nr:type II toxin-antitoxin system RatA family toxin [Pseudomonadota bacterium]